MALRGLGKNPVPPTASPYPIRTAQTPTKTYKLTFQIRGKEIWLNNKLVALRSNRIAEVPLPFSPRCQSAKIIEDAIDFLKSCGISQEVADLPILRDQKKSSFLVYCLVELLKNAIDAIGDSGTVTLSLINRKDHVKIVCKDGGNGISQNMMDAIFKIGRSMKNNPLGINLGGNGCALYCIDQTLKYIKGEIKVESSGPSGTKMVVRLPKEMPKWEKPRRLLRNVVCLMLEIGRGLEAHGY